MSYILTGTRNPSEHCDLMRHPFIGWFEASVRDFIASGHYEPDEILFIHPYTSHFLLQPYNRTEEEYIFASALATYQNLVIL